MPDVHILASNFLIGTKPQKMSENVEMMERSQQAVYIPHQEYLNCIDPKYTLAT